ncbi:MAG: FHA domain-containing protein [Kofleriaceae bacterium]|nr:FHA domain-containing protein [Kofleriaceae bacterium]MCL4225596.1 FHA domain-containing protein [Myxococcales bacterium]
MTAAKSPQSTDPMNGDDVIRFPPPAPATVLRRVGSDDGPIDLTRLGDSTIIGRVPRKTDPPSNADLQLASTKVSLLHAELYRKGRTWRVRDMGSSNGTYDAAGEYHKEMVMLPGRIVRFADVRMIPLNPAQCELRERLRWSLGFDRHTAVDEALSEIAHERPVALVGPTGSEHEALARAIHAASVRSNLPFFVVPNRTTSRHQLVPHRGGTVFLDLNAVERKHIAATFVRALLGAGPEAPLYLRPIIAARSERDVRALFLAHTPLALPTVELPPVRDRRAEVPRMLDELMQRAGRRLADLDATMRAVLLSRPWKRNLEEVRTAGAILGVWLTERSGRKTAEKVGLSHEGVNKFLRSLGHDFGRE